MSFEMLNSALFLKMKLLFLNFNSGINHWEISRLTNQNSLRREERHHQTQDLFERFLHIAKKK